MLIHPGVCSGATLLLVGSIRDESFHSGTSTPCLCDIVYVVQGQVVHHISVFPPFLQVQQLKAERLILLTNMSSLFKTAQAEVKRHMAALQAVRRELWELKANSSNTPANQQQQPQLPTPKSGTPHHNKHMQEQQEQQRMKQHQEQEQRPSTAGRRSSVGFGQQLLDVTNSSKKGSQVQQIVKDGECPSSSGRQYSSKENWHRSSQPAEKQYSSKTPTAAAAGEQLEGPSRPGHREKADPDSLRKREWERGRGREQVRDRSVQRGGSCNSDSKRELEGDRARNSKRASFGDGRWGTGGGGKYGGEQSGRDENRQLQGGGSGHRSAGSGSRYGRDCSRY